MQKIVGKVEEKFKVEKELLLALLKEFLLKLEIFKELNSVK